MRFSALLVRLGVFAIAAIVAGFGARIAVATLETRSVEAVRVALEDRGHGFASVLGGLGVSARDTVVALLFFNIGVEIGQLLFVFTVLVLLMLLLMTGV